MALSASFPVTLEAAPAKLAVFWLARMSAGCSEGVGFRVWKEWQKKMETTIEFRVQGLEGFDRKMETTIGLAKEHGSY